MVCRLWDRSEEFRLWWGRHEVSGSLEGDKVIRHPKAGLLTFRYNTFPLSENSDFLMRVYTPVEPVGTDRQLQELLQESC